MDLASASASGQASTSVVVKKGVRLTGVIVSIHMITLGGVSPVRISGRIDGANCFLWNNVTNFYHVYSIYTHKTHQNVVNLLRQDEMNR